MEAIIEYLYLKELKGKQIYKDMPMVLGVIRMRQLKIRLPSQELNFPVMMKTDWEGQFLSLAT